MRLCLYHIILELSIILESPTSAKCEDGLSCFVEEKTPSFNVTIKKE
jgi:hypothetical protein